MNVDTLLHAVLLGELETLDAAKLADVAYSLAAERREVGGCDAMVLAVDATLEVEDAGEGLSSAQEGGISGSVQGGAREARQSAGAVISLLRDPEPEAGDQ